MTDAAFNPESRFTFPRKLRLTSATQFQAVYDRSVRVSVDPLLVYATPNELDHPRLGLAISRRAGGAVQRNAVKRRLREAFRLLQHDLPQFDFIISAKKHEPLEPASYHALLASAAEQLARKWAKRMETRNEG